jgi:hypothetical protein
MIVTLLVKVAGLGAVATGDDKEMSNLVDDFQDFSEKILDVSPPDKGKCRLPMNSPFFIIFILRLE